MKSVVVLSLMLIGASASAQDGGTNELLEGIDPAMLLDEVNVIAPPLDLSRVAGSAHSVKEEELKQFEYTDVHKSLEKLPGVYVRGEDGFGLRPNIGLRGASSDRSSKIVLMEDGVLLAPAPYSAPAAYYFPLMNRVVGVDVYKGPAAVRFGPNTVGGAVNLRTRAIPELGPAGLIEVGVGSNAFLRTHAAAGYGTERFGLLLEGVHAETDGFKQLDDGGDTGFDKNELTLKARFNPAKSHRLELKLGVATERSNETYLGLTDADFAANPVRRYAASELDQMNWLRTQATLSYAVDLGPVKLTTTAYRHDFHRAWRRLNRLSGRADLLSVLASPQGSNGVYAAILRGEADSVTADEGVELVTNDRRFISQGVQVDGTFEPTAGTLAHYLRFGARLHQDQIVRLHSEVTYLMRSAHLQDAGEGARVILDNEGHTTAFAAYLMDELIWDRLLIVPGARIESINMRYEERGAESGTARASRRHDLVLLPGVGATYSVSSSVNLVAGVHRGFSPVSPGQPASAQPEFSINYEAGVRSTQLINADAILFFTDYSNLTRDCPLSSGCSDAQDNVQTSAGRVLVYGAELSIAHHLDAPGQVGVDARAAYTATLSRFLAEFSSSNPQFGDVQPGDELPYVPPHQATANVTGTRGPLSLGVSAVFVSALREQAGQGEIPEREKIPARATFDLAFSFKPLQGHELYATVENVLDNRYLASRRPYGARPGRPRFFQFGYRYTF